MGTAGRDRRHTEVTNGGSSDVSIGIIQSSGEIWYGRFTSTVVPGSKFATSKGPIPSHSLKHRQYRRTRVSARAPIAGCLYPLSFGF